MPAHAADIFVHPVGIIAYFLTFVVVVGVWFAHNRLFAYYFVRNPVMISINFVMLAFVLLLTYMLQLFMHFGAMHTDAYAALGYFVCFAVVYGLLAVLFAIGARSRWADLDLERRRLGVRSVLRLGSIATGLIVGLGSYFAGLFPLEYTPAAIVPFALASRVAIRFLLPKIT